MASKNSYSYYKNLKDISPIRAMAETVMSNKKVKKLTISEAYLMAKKQSGISETDLLIYPEYAEKVGLPKDSKVLNDCHGKIIGRTAKARKFYDRLDFLDKKRVEGDLREAIFQLEQQYLIKGEAVLGLDNDLMIKATYITTEDDANNLFNWLVNFTPYELVKERYEKSKTLPIQDIIIVAFNGWRNEDPFYHNVGAPQLALIDEAHNVIFNLGMRYFGERKKGTLTLGWSSGMRLGMAACHGGIKEIDFTNCEDQNFRSLGKKSIAFYGLSGTGKSSHTNSYDNGGTLPKGIKKVVLHDDAFQIDTENKVCRVWEPSLFDKTDSREIEHPDWRYVISLMNHATIEIDSKVIPIGLDLRQGNGRALFDRDLLGEWVNRCSFPKALVWLMKDSILPPVIKIENRYLAVAMGAALITKRNRAENVTEEELKKLVFEPFANPFRVYELYKDVESFLNVIDTGAEIYTFNSSVYWKNSEQDCESIPLKTSLSIQTAILTNKLSWEDWDILPGAKIPTKESIDKIIPGYYDRYNPKKRGDIDGYIKLLKDRFNQRVAFLNSSDLQTKPTLLKNILDSLKITK